MCFGDSGFPRGPPRKGRVEKVIEKVVLPWDSLQNPNRQNIVKKLFQEKMLKNIVRKVLQKMSLGIPSSLGNHGFVDAKPLFSHFHLHSQNDTKLSPMGTPLEPLWLVSGAPGDNFGKSQNSSNN